MKASSVALLKLSVRGGPGAHGMCATWERIGRACAALISRVWIILWALVFLGTALAVASMGAEIIEVPVAPEAVGGAPASQPELPVVSEPGITFRNHDGIYYVR